jgi:KUP system potassium uptake protein
MTVTDSTAPPKGRRRTAGLTLAALGVVFGDIGTSPLYTMSTCFSDYTGIKPTPENVLGMLSLITWALIIVVTLKYVLVVMRADNHGEGGVLALMALVSRAAGLSERRRRIYTMLGIAGAALFYGDCLLTPAISVLSAVEGLNVATPDFAPLVVPISIGLIVGLFALQHFGTAGVGRWFGPIMLVWFVVLFLLGAQHVLHHPKVLAALSPLHAIEFAVRYKLVAFVALGAVTLAFTGAEALYADMGHFGRIPIRVAWLGLVLPSLLVNYYGQGALLLDDPASLESPFFRLAPRWALYPLVALATAATVIASQATISGAFSMAQQAALLGVSPRVRILHTSASEFGQIYVPAVNWLQMVGVVALVLAFTTSSNLAAAYGIAVTGTMLVTSVLMFGLARQEWKWSWAAAILVFGFFVLVDVTLVSSNMLKFFHGGWVPLLIAAVIFTAMWTWLKGRLAVAVREKERAVPVDALLNGFDSSGWHRARGTAVYLTAFWDNASNTMRRNLIHNEALHENVVLLTVHIADAPFVAPQRRREVADLGNGMHRVLLRYGFMEKPDVSHDIAGLTDSGIPVDPEHTTYFIGRNSIVGGDRPVLPRWQQKLFLMLARLAISPGDFFGLPANRVVELGGRIEI